MKSALLVFGVCSSIVACGGTQPEPAAPISDDAPAKAVSAEQAALSADEDAQVPPKELAVPDECQSGQECLPDPAWVQKLCNGVFQDVALYMFRAGTPWQRVFLTRETEAVNASGGASVSGTLAFDEEVLVLRHRGGDTGGIQVSGSGGSYDALRWNGSCVTLDGAEVTHTKPPIAKHSRVEWRWLSDEMQAALRKDETVNETYRARRKECKGVSMGAVSKKCELLDHKLVSVIVSHVRENSALPEPAEKP